MKQVSILDNQNIISYNQQNLNEKKKLQQFLIENDISFILNKQGVYEATIKLTQDDNKNENNKSQSPQKQAQKDNKSINGPNSMNNNNKQTSKTQQSNSKNQKGESNQQENVNQNKFQQYLNEKINVFQYLNDQKGLSISPAQQNKLIRNRSEKVINSSNNNNNNNSVSGNKSNNNESLGVISRQLQNSQQSQYNKSRPGSKLNNNQKVEEALNQQQQIQQLQQNNGNKQSKQQSQDRNYVNQESSPYQTDFQTRWRLNRSRTPDSPNKRENMDISMIEMIKNRPQTSNSKKKKKQTESVQFQEEQDVFTKTAFLGLENDQQNKDQKQRKNSVNLQNSFGKSTKLPFDCTLILNKNVSKKAESVTPEKKIISLQKVDNQNPQNQFTINLVEDASAFKNRNNSAKNVAADRRKTINQNLEGNNIFQNKNSDPFGKSSVLGENKLQNKKQSSDKFNQSQPLWLNNMKTASFNKNDQIKEEQEEEITDENQIYQTPSGKKKKDIGRKSQFDKFPSSAEIMKKIQNNYMNPVQYPVVQDKYNYTAIQTSNKPSKPEKSPLKKDKNEQLNTENKSQFSPEISNFQLTQTKPKSFLLNKNGSQNNLTDSSKIQATPAKSRNDKKVSNKSQAKLKTEFTPEKAGFFTKEDFSPAVDKKGQSKTKMSATPSKNLKGKAITDKMQSKKKNDLTPDKSGLSTKEDYLNYSPENEKQKSFQNNTINSFKNSTLLSQFQNKIHQKDQNNPLRETGLSQSEVSMNERSLSSNKKDAQKLINLKNSLNKNKSSRSNTPDRNISLSDASINDRLSFFKNSRLSNMPDIKLQVKQNHNYSAVYLPNESLNGSRPGSKVGMRGAEENNILNSLNNQDNLDFIQNNQPRKPTLQKQEDDYVNGYIKKPINLSKQPNGQNYNSKNDQKEPKHYQIDLNGEEEINLNNQKIDKFERQRQKNFSPEMRQLNKSGQRGSILLLPHRGEFEQDYFSFNSNNINNQFSSQKMLSSQFMNVDKNDPYLQVFRDEDLRMSQGAQEQLDNTYKYTKIEKSSPTKGQNHNNQSILAADDLNVEKLSSNELVHYYKFILEKAKQNQYQVTKANPTTTHKSSQQKK